VNYSFNIRRLHATTKVCREQVLVLQYADDCPFLSILRRIFKLSLLWW